MKNTKRALRRHHRQRMIQRAYRSYVLSYVDDDLELHWSHVLRWHNNLKKCSCYMCGNPRKFRNELPVQERRLYEAARYELAQSLPEVERGEGLSNRPAAR